MYKTFGPVHTICASKSSVLILDSSLPGVLIRSADDAMATTNQVPFLLFQSPGNSLSPFVNQVVYTLPPSHSYPLPSQVRSFAASLQSILFIVRSFSSGRICFFSTRQGIFLSGQCYSETCALSLVNGRVCVSLTRPHPPLYRALSTRELPPHHSTRLGGCIFDWFGHCGQGAGQVS